jgi:hypothetical protein
MADAWKTYPIEFSGGLISNLSPLQQGINAPGSATKLINYEPSVEGGYKRIEGFSKFGGDSAVTVDAQTSLIRGIVRFNNKIIVARGVKLLESADGTSWTTLTSSLGGSDKVRFAKYNFDGNEKLIIVDGTNKPFTYDGTTVTAITNVSSDFTGCERVLVFKNHLFFSNGSTLLFSPPFEDPDALQNLPSPPSEIFAVADGAGIQDIGEVITDLIVFREQLIIFSEKTIKRYSGTNIADFVLQSVSEDLGAVNSDTAKEVGGDVMFLGPDGLRLLSATDRIGDFGLAVVSKPIQSELTNVINTATSFNALVVREKSQYRLFGYNDTYNDLSALGILGTQLATQGGSGFSWSELRGINIFTSFSEYKNDQEDIYFANDDGYVYVLESGNSFDGSNISATFRSPYLPIEDPRVRKTFYKAVVYTDPEGAIDIDFSLKLDFNRVNTGLIQPNVITLSSDQGNIYYFDDIDVLYSDSLTEGSFGYSTFVGVTTESIFETPLIGSGFTVAIEVNSDSTNPPYSLDAVTLEYILNSRR